MKKVDLTAMHPSKVWEIIYPVVAKEFLFGESYVLFAELVRSMFILDPDQWETILNQWEFKTNHYPLQ